MKIRKLALILVLLLIIGCGRAPKIVEEPGKETITIAKLKNGHYQLLIAKNPFIIKGVCYAPIPIGKSHLFNFMCDLQKPWVIDGELMKDMGVNTIRIYQPGDELSGCKDLISDLYNMYGIRTILGHSLGFWDYPPANYADKDFRKQIEENVIEVVNYFKDVPGLLMWNLGNENNYSFDGRLNPWSSPELDAMDSFGKRRDARARIYYSFVNDLAKKIKAIDPKHLVALGNGEHVGLKIAAEYCPDIDALGCIVYRGKVFGNFFKEVKRKFDLPVILTEFGCDAYNMVKAEEDQSNQAKFLKSQWLDLEKNLAGTDKGMGNCLGGVIFEWTDEWWKTSDCDRNSWFIHDTAAGWGMGSYDFDAKAGKNMNEEWFGIVALSEELEAGINKRKPRKAFYVLRQLWNEKYQSKKQTEQNSEK
ncbi:MAG: hypothetical protein ABIG64_09975 [Candidatus Omnitrophota bacterium]